MSLRPDEEEWREVFERLQERFPTVSADSVLQALRNHEGHAGSAAAELRDLTSAVVKAPDPDDAEHVATLLSSPVMFKHACKEEFKKFDANGDGVLEFDEVLQLTNNLYFSFGLQQPSQGSVRAFFDATDENADGVLSEREFRKFFEMFLRYSFFDIHKLRQIVEKGQQKQKKSEPGGKPDNAEPAPQVSSPTRQAWAPMQEVSKSRDRPPTAEEGVRRSLQKEADPASLVAASPQPSTSPEPERKSRHLTPPDTQERSRHDSPQGQRSPKVSPLVYRCVTQHGVSYRKSPNISDRADVVVQGGEKVQVLEHWIRTPQGWLPVEDMQRGQVLFERCSGRSKDKDRDRREGSPRSSRKREECNPSQGGGNSHGGSQGNSRSGSHSLAATPSHRGAPRSKGSTKPSATPEPPAGGGGFTPEAILA